jgi:serine protease Do
MKFLFFSLLFALTCVSLSSQNLREAVAVVRPVYDDATVKFLNDFSKALDRDGYYNASKMLKGYVKGGFGTGFTYKNEKTGKFYIITNRHVVAQAEYVNVEFMISAKENKKYNNCPVIATHDELDIAIVALPEDFHTQNALLLSESAIKDGVEVFSAGFPGLGTEPSWQLGKGIVSNSDLYVDELTNGANTSLVQHTAQVDAGSSGGPLLVVRNDAPFGYEVLGINTWKANGRENVNLSIPVSAIHEFVEDYLNNNTYSSAEALEQRVNALLKASGVDYKKVLPFISYSYISKMSVDNFYDLFHTASENASKEIINNFENSSPIESVRIGLADALCKNLNKKKTSYSSIEHFSQNDKSATVLFSQDSKSVSSKWVAEQGRWRIAQFTALNVNQLDNGIATTYGYGRSIRFSKGLPMDYPDMLATYNFSWGNSFLTFATYDCNIAYTQYNEWEYDNYDNATHQYKDSVAEKKGMLGMEFYLGGQLPIKVSSFYIVPFLKGFGGLFLGDGGGFASGYYGGVELAYKLKKNSYVLLGAGYKYTKFSGDDLNEKVFKPLSTLDVHIGITF